MNRFFPIVGGGETIDRACVNSGLNACCLSNDPTSEELLTNIIRIGDGRTRASLPIVMKRLRVPAATHIVVLHALA